MDNTISEYNNLWNKLNKITEYQNNLFVFTLTSSGAILTYSIQQENIYIALVNMMILILLRCRVMSYRDDYFSTLAYIRAVLEPQLGINSRLGFGASRSKVSHIHYFVYSILGFGTVLTYIWVDKRQYEAPIVTLLILLLLFIVISTLDCYYFFYSNKLYNKYYYEFCRNYKDQMK
jgi:hypothetical protein